jgi:hypothetical protein
MVAVITIFCPKFTQKKICKVKKSILIAIAGCLALMAHAQTRKELKEMKQAERKAELEEIRKKYESGTLVYDKQFALGLQLNYDGYTFYYEKGKYKSVKKTSLLRFEIGERFDPKEIRVQTGNGFSLGTGFKYGKINNFYFFRAAYGEQLLIGGKGPKNGVAFSLMYSGGLSLGLMKPYVLSVQSVGGAKDYTWFDSDTAKKIFLNPIPNNGNYLAEGGGPFKGWSAIKVVPGAHFKVGLRFDYGRFNRSVSALEVGVIGDYMFGDVPILLTTDDAGNINDKGDKKFFFGVYANIMFGSRK